MNYTNSTIAVPVGQSKLIFDESPLVFQPTLAEAIGLEPAIILQQLHFLLQQDKSGVNHPDGKYIYNSYPNWKRQFFPFWSERTIQRYFLQLEKDGLIRSRQEGNLRAKHYRINYRRIEKLISSRQVGTMKNSTVPKVNVPSRQVGTMETDSTTTSWHDAPRQVGTVIQRSHTKKSEETKKSTNISFASDDAGKFIDDEIVLPESSLMALSGDVPAAEKSLHHQLMALIESNIGKLTKSLAGKEGKGAKEVREYMERNPDTTLQDVQDCLTWIQANQKWKQISLTSVASQLPSYMTIKRKNGKVSGTQFLTAQEKNDEIRRNRDYKKIAEEVSEGADKWRIKNFEEKPIAKIEKSVPGTQFKTAQEKSLEKLRNRDFTEMNKGASQIYEQLAARIGTKRKR